MTAAIRQLSYGMASDQVDEYLRMSETTASECLKQFCYGINSMFESIYLREPNEDDVKQLLHVNELRGFPGMLASLDCMHWEWKNCPVAFAGQYTGIDIYIFSYHCCLHQH